MAEEVKFIFSMDDQFTAKAKQAEASVGGLESKLSSLGGVVATAFSVGAVANFAKSTLESFGKFEQFQTSLTTMFQGNRKEAELLTGQLQDFAKSTPFELTEIQEATKMMLAYGSTSGGVVKEMTMLGDISSGVGAPLKDIAYLYGTLRTQGRAYAMDIRQFAGRGIPIIEALAKQFNVSKSEVMKLVEEGKVGFPQVEKALKSLTEQGGQFAGMMEQQSKTLNGQLSNLADGWEQLKVSIGESQSGIVKSTTEWATSMLNEINGAIRMQNQLEKAFKGGNATQYTRLEMAGGAATKDLVMQQAVSSMVKSAAGNELAIAQTQQKLSASINKLIARREAGKVGDTEFTRQMAILKSGKEDLALSLDQLKKTNAKNAEDMAAVGKKEKDSKAKESSKVASQKYTQITINIDKLIEDFNVETSTMEKGATGAKEQVVKALIEAVNDSQIVAGI